MKARIHVWASLFAAGLLLSGCSTVSSLADRFTARPTATPSALSLSGTIEAEEITVAAEVSGRVVTLAVDEGDRVEVGQVLVQLDATALNDQRDQAQAAVDQAQAALDAAKAQLALTLAGARTEEISASESNLDAAKANLTAAEAQAEASASQLKAAEAGLAAAQGQLTAAQAGVTAAQAQIDAAQAQLTKGLAGSTEEELSIAEHAVEVAKNSLWGYQAQRDAICGHIGGTVTQADCDAAQAAVQAAEEQVRIAELQLEQARNGLSEEDAATLRAQLTQAQAGLKAAQGDAATAQANVDAAAASVETARANQKAAQAQASAAGAQRNQAQAALDLLRAGAAPEQIDILNANVAQAEAALAGVRAALAAVDTQVTKFTLTAPISAVVLDRLIAESELTSAGAPLLTLADLNKLTLTVYVPEADLGRVALGQTAQVTVDSYDDTFQGTVTYIASSAEYTPKNVDTREERVNMVFAMKISLDNSDHRLLPGMPADVELR